MRRARAQAQAQAAQAQQAAAAADTAAKLGQVPADSVVGRALEGEEAVA